MDQFTSGNWRWPRRKDGARFAAASTPRYDHIGTGYARLRREDPRLRTLIHEALGDARTVVNVGAGAGSYEPQDRHVIAIEPSDVMAAQRSPARVPAVRGSVLLNYDPAVSRSMWLVADDTPEREPGALRGAETHDVGLRLVVTRP